MNDATFIKTGAIGTLIVAVCCATPILAIALGAVGLSALTSYLDYLLLPALAVCLGVVGYGFYKRHQTAAACCRTNVTSKPERT